MTKDEENKISTDHHRDSNSASASSEWLIPTSERFSLEMAQRTLSKDSELSEPQGPGQAIEDWDEPE